MKSLLTHNPLLLKLVTSFKERSPLNMTERLFAYESMGRCKYDGTGMLFLNTGLVDK